MLLHKYASAGLSKGDNFDLVMAAFKVTYKSNFCISILKEVLFFVVTSFFYWMKIFHKMEYTEFKLQYRVTFVLSLIFVELKV